jgi:hypothetical protein
MEVVFRVFLALLGCFFTVFGCGVEVAGEWDSGATEKVENKALLAVQR